MSVGGRTARLAGGLLTAAQLAAGAAVVTRLARGYRRTPPLTPGAAAPDEPVSVVIPARDEEHRLGPCLQALAGDPAVTEVIVVDDQSADGTAALAASYGARVVAGEAPPEGWVGKPWALQQGLVEAKGPWVVTLDADTRPAPGLVAAAVAAATAGGHDLLSVAAGYECDGVLEQAVHASMLATLVYRFGPPDALHEPRPSRVLANGQCLVFRRDTLRVAGGFALAGPYLTDDVALARQLAGMGWRVGMADASALLTVDMHEGARSAWREWGRSLPLADVTAPLSAAADAATYALTAGLPVARLLTGRPTRTDVALLAVRGALLVALRGSYRGSWWGLLASPLADPLVAARLAYGVLRPSRRWRGRTYAPGSGVAARAGRRGISGR